MAAAAWRRRRNIQLIYPENAKVSAPRSKIGVVSWRRLSMAASAVSSAIVIGLIGGS
jgi:hypothetical protein